MPASDDIREIPGQMPDHLYEQHRTAIYENGEWRPWSVDELARQQEFNSPRTQSPRVRTFSSGATRDIADGKPEPWRAGSALVEKRYAEYMYSHRIQHDGSLRASDNWKKGFPVDSFFDSMSRHILDLRLLVENFPEEATEQDLEVVLCAVRFNVDGLLHETIKARLAGEDAKDVGHS